MQESEEGYNDRLAYGMSAMQGWRVSMVSEHTLGIPEGCSGSLFKVTLFFSSFNELPLIFGDSISL